MAERRASTDNPPPEQQGEVEERELVMFCCAGVELLTVLPENDLDTVTVKRVVYHSWIPTSAICHTIDCKWDITGLPLSNDPWPERVRSMPISLGHCSKIWLLELVFSAGKEKVKSGCFGTSKSSESPEKVKSGCFGKSSESHEKVKPACFETRKITENHVILDVLLYRLDNGVHETIVTTKTYVIGDNKLGAFEICANTYAPGGGSNSVLPMKKCPLLPLHITSHNRDFRAEMGMLTVQCLLDIEDCCLGAP